MTTTAQTPFEVRFDSLVMRLQHLARVAGGGTIGNELKDVADEMVRIRRDMSNHLASMQVATVLEEMSDALGPEASVSHVHLPPRRPYRPRGTATPIPSPDPKGRNGKARRGTQKIAGFFVQVPKGKRWCQAHDEGKGAMLDETEFKVKNPRTGQRTSWCTACTRDYQQKRYVRVGYKRVTIEVVDGDACLGHECPLCHLPFQVGERVQGSDLAHETCLNLRDGL